MKPKVYVETSFISYLTSEISSDLIVAAHQRITRDWWENRRLEFDLYISQTVIDEAREGNTQESAKRLDALAGLLLLEVTNEAVDLADVLVYSKKVLPEKVYDDALHIALATVHEMDYLLTWNCSHIANPAILKKLEKIISEQGYEMPIICTPELMGE